MNDYYDKRIIPTRLAVLTRYQMIDVRDSTDADGWTYLDVTWHWADTLRHTHLQNHAPRNWYLYYIVLG